MDKHLTTEASEHPVIPEQSPQGSSWRPEGSEQSPQGSGRRPRPRVLLVDDNATSMRLMEMILTSHGFDTVSETDAMEAVERARREAFDVMIVDLQMWPVGGMEVLQRAKDLVPRLYLLTGYASSEEEKQALALGARAVLQKPLDANELLSLLNTID